jgi:uncharacterized protein (TIGR03066 family)
MQFARIIGLVVLLGLAAAVSAAPKNQELIVGKWDPGMSTIFDYKKDGTFTMTIGTVVINGKYKFLSDDVMEVAITFNEKTKTNKLKVAIKDDEMTTTDPEGKSTTLKRVK